MSIVARRQESLQRHRTVHSVRFFLLSRFTKKGYHNTMEISEFASTQNKTLEVLSKKLFFISGVPKSGTTWMQKALDAHPQISCAGEGHFFNVLADFIGQSIEIYNNKLLDTVAREVYEGNPYYPNITDNDLHFLVRTFVGLMLAKRGIKESALHIGDKTPANALMLEQIRSVFPETKFIHVYRDGRDVALSTYKHGLRNKENPSLSKCIELAAERWVQYNRAAIEFGKKHGDALLMVSYEAMTANFMQCFSSILQFLGADDSETVIEYCRASSSFEWLSGGRKPGEEDSNSFYRKGVVGDWQYYFSPENLEAFNRIGGEMLKELGYETGEDVNMLPSLTISPPILTGYVSAESRL